MTNLIKNSFFIFISFSVFLKFFVVSFLLLLFATILVEQKMAFHVSASSSEVDKTFHGIICFSSISNCEVLKGIEKLSSGQVSHVTHRTEGQVNYTVLVHTFSDQNTRIWSRIFVFSAIYAVKTTVLISINFRRRKTRITCHDVYTRTSRHISYHTSLSCYFRFKNDNYTLYHVCTRTRINI